ncbi:MAG TPA: GLPGLI family protein [Chitinophagaceae bacterium]|nr:GLPGLI family protein [Chitinophagaceae bacterium]
MRIIIIMVLLIAVKVNAQDFEIEYQVRFNDLYDRGRNDRLHNGFLLIDNNKSRYYTVETEKYKPKDEHDVMIMPDTANQVYIDISSGVLFSEETDLRKKSFFVSDSLYPMKWKITAEERMIDSIRCIKATCEFRGREYVAWFSPNIPLSFGPWKMGGLPGLIVDLQDSGENLLIRLKRLSQKDVAINLPGAIRYSKDEHVAEIRKLFARLKESSRASSTGDCATCQQQSVIEFFSWEKISQ